MNKERFEDLKGIATRQLAQRIDCLNELQNPKLKLFRLRSSRISNKSVRQLFLNEVKRWVGASKNTIYLIETQKIDAKKMELIRSRFGKPLKANLPARKYSQWNDGVGRCLYVGSSQKVTQRLKEHLGFGAKGTYALNLIYWSRDIDLPLTFRVLKFPENVDYRLIQHLEDVIWEKETPLFGRQGRR